MGNTTRVLIAEDDAIVATHLKRVLERAGNEVVALAACGEDAIALVETLRPDILLMDVCLRGPMTGVEASARIRAAFNIPIVYLTAYPNDTLLQEVKHTEPFGFLVKPVRENELIATIEMATHKHQIEIRLRHLMSVLRAVRGISRLITHQKNPAKLLAQACKILYNARGYSLVWIGRLEASDRHIQLVAKSGDKTDPSNRLIFNLDRDDFKDGPVMVAIETRRPFVVNDHTSQLLPEPLKNTAIEHKLNSGAVIPIFYQKRIYGFIAVCAEKPNAFDDEEVSLLKEMAADLAYGLKAIEEEATRKSVEKSLRESEESYRRIIETAAEGVVEIDPDSKIILVNPRMAHFLGYAQDELINQDIRQFFAPQSIATYEGAMTDLKDGKSGWYRGCMKRKNGEELWVLVSASPILTAGNQFSSVLAMISNITDLKTAEDQLRRRVLELEVIYENGLGLGRIMETKEIGRKAIDILARKMQWHYVAVWFTHPETNQLELAAYRSAGIPEEALNQGMERVQALLKEGRGISASVIQSGESVLCEDVTQDPRYIAAFEDIKSALYVPIKAVTRTLGVFVLQSKQENAFQQDDLRMVTTLAIQVGIAIENSHLYQTAREEVAIRKQIEAELIGLNQQLERRVSERTEELNLVNAALERSSHMKDEFLASMSHELRTPLTGVLNLSEVLQEQVYGSLNEKQIQFLQTIESSGQHLLGLINDILDLSKIEAGQLELQSEICSANEICQSSLQLIRGMSQKKNQGVSYNIYPANIELIADARRIKQMLVNLLSNAVKFTPEGGQIGLRVEGDERKGEVRFTVWDTGIGIDQENMVNLFRPFTQLDSRLSRTHSGTGLGLALVKRMADLHQATVTVKSQPGEGSQFTVTLPWKTTRSVEPGQGEFSAQPPEAPLQGDGSQHSRSLVLIVDDHEVNRSVYADYLKIRGLDVITAQNGGDAIRLAEERHPDVILMDIQMAGMDGLTAIRQIRNRNGRAAPVPIIALTALAMVGDRERCLAAGADDYLSKPVALKDLLATIQRYLVKARS